MNLFIDTNVYLTFYHFTNDDLEELRKLLVAISDRKIILYLPQQVVMEFKRNREAKIVDALNKLNEQKLPEQFPQICKEYPEYKTLRLAIRSFRQAKSELIEKLVVDIRRKSLLADEIILELFNKARELPTTDEILLQAKNRFDIGNPPGKDGSYGDSINWISLVNNASIKGDLHIVARDKDYLSKIDNNSLPEFLAEEWQDKKSAQAYLYTSLSDFFNQHFPNIKLASEMEKQFAVSNFVNSDSFAATHLAIAKLSRFSEFSDREVDEIIRASVTNDQIHAIREDKDVKNFLNNILKGRENAIDPRTFEVFNAIFNSAATLSPEEEANLPF